MSIARFVFDYSVVGVAFGLVSIVLVRLLYGALRLHKAMLEWAAMGTLPKYRLPGVNAMLKIIVVGAVLWPFAAIPYLLALFYIALDDAVFCIRMIES